MAAKAQRMDRQLIGAGRLTAKTNQEPEPSLRASRPASPGVGQHPASADEHVATWPDPTAFSGTNLANHFAEGIRLCLLCVQADGITSLAEQLLCGLARTKCYVRPPFHLFPGAANVWCRKRPYPNSRSKPFLPLLEVSPLASGWSSRNRDSVPQGEGQHCFGW